MPSSFKVEDLKRLKRNQLQKLAKQNGVKANMKTDDIVAALKTMLLEQTASFTSSEQCTERTLTIKVSSLMQSEPELGMSEQATSESPKLDPISMCTESETGVCLLTGKNINSEGKTIGSPATWSTAENLKPQNTVRNSVKIELMKSNTDKDFNVHTGDKIDKNMNNEIFEEMEQKTPDETKRTRSDGKLSICTSILPKSSTPFGCPSLAMTKSESWNEFNSRKLQQIKTDTKLQLAQIRDAAASQMQQTRVATKVQLEHTRYEIKVELEKIRDVTRLQLQQTRHAMNIRLQKT